MSKFCVLCLSGEHDPSDHDVSGGRCGWCDEGPVDGLFGAAIDDTPYHHGAWPDEVGPSCYELAQGDPDVIEQFMAAVLRGVTVDDRERP